MESVHIDLYWYIILMQSIFLKKNYDCRTIGPTLSVSESM
jgi:hypothetical protein